MLNVMQVLAAHAAKHPLQTMQQNGLTHFEQLVKIAGAHDALSKHSVRITILAPSDQVREPMCNSSTSRLD
jgi:hypothetical protein